MSDSIKPLAIGKKAIACLIFIQLGGILLSACLPLSPLKNSLPTDTPSPPTPSPSPTTDWFPATPTATHVLTIHRSITPSPDISLKYGQAIFSDNFSQAANWETGKFPDGLISLGANELSLSVTSPRGYVISPLNGFDQADFYLEITTSPTICRGKDEYGLLLRMSSAQNFFRFALMCDGHARLDRVLDGQASATIPPVVNSAVPPGAPSSSRLGILADGKNLAFYANGQYLFDISNASLLDGGLGIFARLSDEGSMTVNFSDLIIYALLK